METVYFTLAAIILYFVSDRRLERIEVACGARFEHRSLVFFGILLGFSLIGFAVIRHVSGPGAAHAQPRPSRPLDLSQGATRRQTAKWRYEMPAPSRFHVLWESSR